MQEDGLLHTTCGTPNYVAPEVFLWLLVQLFLSTLFQTTGFTLFLYFHRWSTIKDMMELRQICGLVVWSCLSLWPGIFLLRSPTSWHYTKRFVFLFHWVILSSFFLPYLVICQIVLLYTTWSMRTVKYFLCSVGFLVRFRWRILIKSHVSMLVLFKSTARIINAFCTQLGKCFGQVWPAISSSNCINTCNYVSNNFHGSNLFLDLSLDFL